MVIELSFVLSFALHFGHMFKRVKHALDDAFVPCVYQAPNLQPPGSDELVLDAADVRRKVLDKMSDPPSLLAS